VPWLIVVIIVSFFANRAGLPLLPMAEWVGYLICAFLAVPGVALIVLGVKACSLRVLSGRDKSTLVTKGIYSYIRHPICLSCVLLAFSAATGFRSAVGLMIVILAIVIIYGRVLFEEKELERRFGRAYCEYKSKVGMFVPKRKRARNPR
jgi:protein-S-isoprenylcysteine O-methyltransferase Ste14